MKKGPGNQHCSDLSATLPSVAFSDSSPSERGAEENYLETLNLNVAVCSFFHCFQCLRASRSTSGTLKALYFVVHSIIRDSAFSPITTKSPRTIP